MKKLVILLLLLVASTGFGAMIEAESLELRLKGGMDFDNSKGEVETSVDIGLGYFIFDDIEVGGLISFGFTESDAGFGLGGFSEFLFDLNCSVAPYVGIALQYKFGDYYSDHFLLLDLSGGLKFFITDSLAISTELFYDLASEDIYINNEEAADDDSGIRIGLSYYF